MSDAPLLCLALTIWIYWGGVVRMVRRVERKGRRSAGMVPRLARERWLWLVWVPVILAWLVLPVLAILEVHPALSVPRSALAGWYAPLRWVAAATAAACLLATVDCWRSMGRSWRLAVVPGERTDLITGRLYAWIRHPIYALSILLMTATVVILPVAPMAAAAAVHVGLMLLKARSEERFLHEQRGEEYAAYCRRTGRFLPRLHREAGG